MLTFNCFKLPTETNNLEFDWTFLQPISKEEFYAQINFELGTFFFHKEEYIMARQHFFQSLSNYKNIIKTTGFATLDPNVLQVYVQACSGPSEGSKDNLLEQLNYSVVNQYMVCIFYIY